MQPETVMYQPFSQQRIYHAILWASIILSAARNTSTADDKKCTKHSKHKGAHTSTCSLACLWPQLQTIMSWPHLQQHLYTAMWLVDEIPCATRNTIATDNKNSTKHGKCKGSPTGDSSIASLPYICTHTQAWSQPQTTCYPSRTINHFVIQQATVP